MSDQPKDELAHTHTWRWMGPNASELWNCCSKCRAPEKSLQGRMACPVGDQGSQNESADIPDWCEDGPGPHPEHCGFLSMCPGIPKVESDDCSGTCLSGHDIGIPNDGIAYPHPDCLAHGDLWKPSGNEWSRQYVAEHPERFGFLAEIWQEGWSAGASRRLSTDNPYITTPPGQTTATGGDDRG